MSAGLRAGQVAAAAGVNLQTLRYYERRGPLDEPGRTLGGHRIYPDQAVTLLRVIKTAQRFGFSLNEVAELLETGTHHHGRGDAGLQAKATAKVAEIDQKIADLTVIRDPWSWPSTPAATTSSPAPATPAARCPSPS